MGEHLFLKNFKKTWDFFKESCLQVKIRILKYIECNRYLFRYLKEK